jgi:hypothetical protein
VQNLDYIRLRLGPFLQIIEIKGFAVKILKTKKKPAFSGLSI